MTRVFRRKTRAYTLWYVVIDACNLRRITLIVIKGDWYDGTQSSLPTFSRTLEVADDGDQGGARRVLIQCPCCCRCGLPYVLQCDGTIQLRQLLFPSYTTPAALAIVPPPIIFIEIRQERIPKYPARLPKDLAKLAFCWPYVYSRPSYQDRALVDNFWSGGLPGLNDKAMCQSYSAVSTILV